MVRQTVSSALLFALAILAFPAHAQMSVYVVGGLAHYSVFENSTSTNLSQGDAGGFGGGAFFNFPIQSRVTLGIDERAEYTPGSKGGFLSGTALRVGFVPQRVRLCPFFQLGGGVVHSSYTKQVYVGFSSTYTPVQQSVTNGAAQVVFGLDIRLNDHFDLRAPELGGQAADGNGINATGSFLNVGLVYHLHPRH